MTSLEVVTAINGNNLSAVEAANVLDQWFAERASTLAENLLGVVAALAESVKVVNERVNVANARIDLRLVVAE